MRNLIYIAILACSMQACKSKHVTHNPFYEFRVMRLDGTEESLSQYKGKVLLVVNTASECGFTPQYADLQRLYEEFKDRGFEVLGFPSNDFGGQEPGDSAQIENFCSSRFHITFPMFGKIKVRGDDAAPLYRYLTQREGPPRWNFYKYLINKKGDVVTKYSSVTNPMSARVRHAIADELRK